MTEATRLVLRALRGFGLRPAARYLRLTENLLTHSYIPIYLIGFILAIWLESWKTAVWTAAICDIIALIFGARIVLIYGLARPLIERIFKTNLLTVGMVWYWNAFIAMWMTLPLYALAILQPWRVHWTTELLLAIFMLMHVVATQRSVGAFWRKVYGALTVAVIVVTVFAITMPSTFNRWRGGYGLSQNLDQIQAIHEAQAGHNAEEELRKYDDRIDALTKEKYDAGLANMPWNGDAEVTRLEGLRAELMAKHRALESSATDSIKPSGFNSGSLLMNPTYWDDRTIATVVFGLLSLVGIMAVMSGGRKPDTTATHPTAPTPPGGH